MNSRMHFLHDKLLGNLLVQMYGKCGSLANARCVFDTMLNPNVFSWTIMVTAYANNGYLVDARKILKNMPEENTVCWTAMIAAYASNGQLQEAKRVFDNMPEKDVVSWNTMIAAYARMGHHSEAMLIFRLLDLQGVKPSSITFISILDVCITLPEVNIIHDNIDGNELQHDIQLSTTILNVYGRCGSVENAKDVFDQMRERNVVTWNSMISTYTFNGHPYHALVTFRHMRIEGLKPDKITFASIVDAYARLGAVEEGKQFHGIVECSGCELDGVLATSLMNMYGECGNLKRVVELFEQMPEPDLVSWNSIIAAHTKNLHGKEALDIYRSMSLEGVKPDKVTFIAILDACCTSASLESGNAVRAMINESSCFSDVMVNTALLNMYGKCRNLQDAKKLFDEMRERDIIAWNTMIGIYGQNALGEQAFEIFQMMDLEGVPADEGTLVSMLDACASVSSLQLGKLIHGFIDSDSCNLLTPLMNMYAKCGSLNDARIVFDKMPTNDTVLWNSMMCAYTRHGYGKEAMEMFHKMSREGVKPDEVTYVNILNTCSRLAALEGGKAIHDTLKGVGIQSNMVFNALVDMYGKCGSIENAKYMFDRMSNRDLVSWNAMVAVYARNGNSQKALELFQAMDIEGIQPDVITFIIMADACSDLSMAEDALVIYDDIIKCRFSSNTMVTNALVNMYGKCGRLQDAKLMFDTMEKRDVVSWNGMITLYTKNGHAAEAIITFCIMDLEGIQPDIVTFVSIIDACSNCAAIDQGMNIDASVNELGLQCDSVLANAIMNMYNKCKMVQTARSKFEGLVHRDIVSWNGMIVGYAQNGHGMEAMEMFLTMDLEGMKPDEITFLCILEGCSCLGDIAKGELIHECIISSRYDTESVTNALVSMYSRCGGLVKAKLLFDVLCCPSVASWNSMVAGYAQYGHIRQSLELLKEMVIEGSDPNETTFMNVLCTCSHSGNLENAVNHFISMNEDYNIAPGMDHYVCMIDLLGRIGRLEEAEELIHNMPFEFGHIAWCTLLGASKVQNDVQRGARAAQKVLLTNPEKAATYVLLSSIYAAD